MSSWSGSSESSATGNWGRRCPKPRWAYGKKFTVRVHAYDRAGNVEYTTEKPLLPLIRPSWPR
jgi:hypothetical protein